jgi:hypothetical protein
MIKDARKKHYVEFAEFFTREVIDVALNSVDFGVLERD